MLRELPRVPKSQGLTLDYGSAEEAGDLDVRTRKEHEGRVVRTSQNRVLGGG